MAHKVKSEKSIASELDEELAFGGLDTKTRNWLKRNKRSVAKSRTYQRRADEPVAITPVEYGGPQEAYDFFNTELFGGGLVDVFSGMQTPAAISQLTASRAGSSPSASTSWR
jgi:hypothetical protein